MFSKKTTVIRFEVTAKVVANKSGDKYVCGPVTAAIFTGPDDKWIVWNLKCKGSYRCNVDKICADAK